MSAQIKPKLIIQIALGAILAIELLWFYYPTLFQLVSQLAADEENSFALLMPLVSAYIVYLKWPQVLSQPRRPSWWGLMIMALGFLFYVLGELMSVIYFHPLSFIVILTGLLLLLGGWKLVRLLTFPLFLLVLMVPLPALILKQITLPLQLISSNLAAGLLQAIGIPLVRQGNVIDLGVRQLQIVGACSGLRYILSISALGFIYCYFFQRCIWKAIVIIISLIPAAILANALRVAAMGIFPALMKGFWHMFSGWLIFLCCLVFLTLISRTLDYLSPRTIAPVKNESASTEATVQEVRSTTPFKYMICAVILVTIASPLSLKLTQARPVPLVQGFDKFPMHLGPWRGERSYLDPSMAKAVGADDYLEANYISPANGPVSLWIAFFENQSKKVEGRIHSPLLCLQGSGWKIVESKIVSLGPGLPVHYLVIEQGGSRQLVYYWYLQRGRWLASEYPGKFYMGWDGLVRRRNDGAIIRLVTPVKPDADSSRLRLDSFSRLLIPLLPQFIPH